MATSPTILVDHPSSPPSTAAAPQNVSAAAFPIIPLLIAVVIGVAVAAGGIGGAVYFLIYTGRLSTQSMSHKTEQPELVGTARVIVLDPMLVNLAGDGVNSYLRVAITLRVLEPAEKKDEKSKEEKTDSDAVAAVRDTMLGVLGRQTAEDLLSVDGKENLKAQLKSALTTHNPQLKVTDVFFTDYLVQR